MSKKLTTEDFILKARQVHGWKYDYSKVNYINAKTKVCIICPKHGEFWQTPNRHLKCQGCPICGRINCRGNKKYDTSKFIDAARKVHGDKYGYSKVKYINNKTKVCIICPVHGEFWQTPDGHLAGNGCLYCKGNKLREAFYLGKDKFISIAKSKFGDKYDYSKVEYVNIDTKVCIICKNHGQFWQTPSTHLKGRGCPFCSKEIGYKPRVGFNIFKERADIIHGGKYTYIEDSYNGLSRKVKIICHTHGEFYQLANQHLKGRGCPKCGINSASKKKTYTTEEFIKLCKIVHHDKYDYSLTTFENIKKKIEIICPKHGVFTQKADLHLNSKCGCPICNSSHGELKIEQYLKTNNIKYEAQYHVKLQEQMFSRNNLRVDFYLPEYNTFLEFNGEQHYRFVNFFHNSEDDFQKQVERDKRLKDYCKENKIKLIVIKYNQIDKIEEILNKKLKIN